MGIGLSLVAKKPRRGLLSFLTGNKSWKARVESAVNVVATKYGLAQLIDPVAAGSKSQISGNYCEEWIDLAETDDSLVLSAKTSSCGPGYHAFLIDLVDYLAKEAGLVFSEDDENTDETSYFSTRDFEGLQRSHATWFRVLIRSIVSEGYIETGTGMISMPIGGILPLPTPNSVQTPRGLLERSQIEAIAKASDTDLLQFAERWFPWWNRTPSAVDWSLMGKTLLWLEVPWHKPMKAPETHAMEAAIHCFQKAKLADPAADLPAREIRELDLLLSGNVADDYIPASTGAGYRRRLCSWTIGPGWSIELPGYWYEFEEGESSGIRFGSKFVWISTYAVDRVESGDGSARGPIDLTKISDDSVLLFEELGEKRNIRLSQVEHEGQAIFVFECMKSDGFAVVSFEGFGTGGRKEVEPIARSVT